jgi:flagellar biogenesis protein FliO
MQLFRGLLGILVVLALVLAVIFGVRALFPHPVQDEALAAGRSRRLLPRHG